VDEGGSGGSANGSADGLDRPRAEARALAEELAAESLRETGLAPRTCGVPVMRGPWAGKNCLNPAGLGTVHEGYGPCLAHGGAKYRGRALGAWMAAHAIAREYDTSPWEALLLAVRVAHGKLAWYQAKLADTESDDELRMGGAGYDWVAGAQFWHDRLLRSAKMAVDAGVAERLVAQVELEGSRIARVLNAAMDGVAGEIPVELERRMRELMRRELLAIEAEDRREPVAIEGEVAVQP